VNIDDFHSKSSIFAEAGNLLTGINKEVTNTPDHPKNHSPKSACFNRLYSKTQKNPMDCFLSVCIPDHIFPDGPEIPILPGSDFKIA